MSMRSEMLPEGIKAVIVTKVYDVMMVLLVWQPVGWISLQTKYTQQ